MSPMPTWTFGKFTLQTWDGQERAHEDICGLSYYAAIEIACAHLEVLPSCAVRLISEVPGDDFTLVVDDQGVRSGPFAKTTLVSVGGE